jgi:hypothetical protein
MARSFLLSIILRPCQPFLILLTQSVQPQGFTPTGSWQEYVKAYFDWNQDGDFEDTGEGIEIGHCSSNGCIVSANINIPGTASLGSTRMRIVLQYNSYHGPCGSYTYGDTEDYSVIIQI